MKRVIPVFLMLGATVLAGCTGATNDDSSIEEGGDAALLGENPGEDALSADSQVPAPEWQIGDYFGHHIFFGSEDLQGTHIDAIVVDKSGSNWILSADNEEAAKWEAAWDFPMLGEIDGKSLDTTAFGADWNLYDFPLSDGKTWTSTFNPLFSGTRELSMTATFEANIKTVGQGTKAGFIIEGVNDDGEVELKTDYIPDLGWYSELTYFDPLTQVEDDFILRVWAMGQGHDWQGTYIDATAEQKLLYSGCLAPPVDQQGAPSTTCTQGAHHEDFDIGEDADEFYGIIFVGAAGGNSRLDIYDGPPNPSQANPTSYEATSSDPNNFESDFAFAEVEDPFAGTWSMDWTGSGFVAIGYTQAWEIRYTETQFP